MTKAKEKYTFGDPILKRGGGTRISFVEDDTVLIKLSSGLPTPNAKSKTMTLLIKIQEQVLNKSGLTYNDPLGVEISNCGNVIKVIKNECGYKLKKCSQVNGGQYGEVLLTIAPDDQGRAIQERTSNQSYDVIKTMYSKKYNSFIIGAHGIFKSIE